MTALLFRADAYARDCTAHVAAATPEGGIILDQTVFYPTSGGQPGDRGWLAWEGGRCAIANTIHDAEKRVIHVPAAGENTPPPGSEVRATLDWDSRFINMRCHTLMHLLCASVPFPVTGSAITADGGRIDFDIPEGRIPDRQALTERLNSLITADHPVTTRWITDAEMDANPKLVRTMFVKPPRGAGKVRLVAIGRDGEIDLQPCGGTHLSSTAAIGPVTVTKIENKGKINRRIRVSFV